MPLEVPTRVGMMAAAAHSAGLIGGLIPLALLVGAVAYGLRWRDRLRARRK